MAQCPLFSLLSCWELPPFYLSAFPGLNRAKKTALKLSGEIENFSYGHGVSLVAWIRVNRLCISHGQDPLLEAEALEGTWKGLISILIYLVKQDWYFCELSQITAHR